MSDKIYVTLDDHEIIDYITDAGFKHDDDNMHRIFTFFYNKSYHLVLYFATPGDKGFLMYKIDDIRNNMHELQNLKLTLMEILKTGNNVAIIKDAIEQVETIQIAGLAAEIFKREKK